MPSSRGFSQTRVQTQVSSIASRLFTSWATKDVKLVIFIPLSPIILAEKIENFIFNWSRNVEISIFSIWSMPSKCIDKWTSIRKNAEGNVYSPNLMHFKQKGKFAKVEVVKKKKKSLLHKGATLGLQCCHYGMAWEGRPSGEMCKHAM